MTSPSQPPQPPSRKIGRPSKYTPERVQRIIQALELGSTRGHAARYGGIDVGTLIDWTDRYPDFSKAVHEAEARGVMKWLAVIERAANSGDWKAAAWKLERRYPQDYARRTMIDIEQDIRMAARAAGVDEEAAILEAERLLNAGRRQQQ